MWKDPIVEEVRQYGNTYAAQFHEDLAAMFHDLQDKQKYSTRSVVSLKPRLYHGGETFVVAETQHKIGYPEQRAARSSQKAFEDALAEIPDVEPEEHDKL
jgi:hypothetical protein